AQRRLGYTPSPALQALHDQGGDRVGVNLEALRQINQVVLAAGGQLAIAMTPLRRELDSDGPRDYELVARQRLTALAQSEGIPYLDGLPLFQQTAHERLYSDHIHLSLEGNAWVSQVLAQLLLELWNREPDPALPPAPDPLSDLW
ncbi:MAG: lipolytic protein G-D-S-L family, partial [Leptolyngbya sp.]